MKKILIATNMSLLAFVIFQACHHKPVPNADTNHSFCGDTTCFNFDGSELQGTIDFKLAVSMSSDYANDDGKKFIWDDHNVTNAIDSRSIWFDLKKIKKFIGFIESSLCKASCVKTDNYGIRMYFAKYPGEAEMQKLSDLYGVPLEYAHHHTLFMVPTYRDPVSHKNIDFDPALTLSDCKVRPIDSTTKYLVLPWAKTTGAESEEQNHGSLMPPPATEGSFPTPQN